LAIVTHKISAISDAMDFLRTGAANVQTQIYTDKDADQFNVCETFEEVCALFLAAQQPDTTVPSSADKMVNLQENDQ
jgi:hypothetical protein